MDEAERLAAATSTSKSKDDRPAKNYDRDTKVVNIVCAFWEFYTVKLTLLAVNRTLNTHWEVAERKKTAIMVQILQRKECPLIKRVVSNALERINVK